VISANSGGGSLDSVFRLIPLSRADSPSAFGIRDKFFVGFCLNCLLMIDHITLAMVLHSLSPTTYIQHVNSRVW